MENPSSRRDYQDLLIPGLLGLAWVACAIIINPIGDFPLTDDWAFGAPVEALLSQHKLRFTDWQAPTLIAQVLWGALFCLPGGFSFTALRISTLVLGLAGILGTYPLLRHLGAGRRIATLGTAVLAFNPFYVFMSYSFMTDIPFLSLMILSILLLLRGVDLGREGELIAGLVLACLSVFIRQTGLLILIGFLVAYPVRRAFGQRWVLFAVIPTIVAYALLRLFEHYLKIIGEVPGGYGNKSVGIKQFFSTLAHGHVGAFKQSLWVLMSLLMYLGLWTLPIMLPIAPRALARFTPAGRRAAWLMVAGVTVGVTALLALRGWLMPMIGNQWSNFHMGVIELPGEVPGLPQPFGIGITAVAVMGAALMILTLGVFAREKWTTRHTSDSEKAWPWQVVFLLVVGAMNFGLLAFAFGSIFDRYFLVFLPLLLGLLVALGRGPDLIPVRSLEWLSACIMAVYLVFGVAATHDFLAWNRARWAAATELQERWGVPKEEIDGGFEYNNLLDSRERLRTRWVHRPGVYDPIQGTTRPYLLAVEPLPAHEILGQIECRPWLPRGVSRVYYLRRPSAGSSEKSRGTDPSN